MTGPAALLAARLCEVAPDGGSARVTYGLFRLRRPAGVAPGARFRITLDLKAVGYAFNPGARLRLALSDAYWPMAWPEPAEAGLVLHPAGGTLSLPLLGAEDAPAPRFGLPVAAAPMAHEILEPEAHRRLASHDLATGESAYRVEYRRNKVRLGDLVFAGHGEESYRIRRDDPTSAETRMARSYRFERPGWRIRVETQTVLCRDAGDLRLDSRLAAFENETEVFARQWTHRFPTDTGNNG
jgi:hypothetical protein